MTILLLIARCDTKKKPNKLRCICASIPKTQPVAKELLLMGVLGTIGTGE